MNIYVGNLSFDMTEDDLRQLFSQHGEVASASIIMDRETGRSRGFGFVEMTSQDEAQDAITKLNSSEFMGRTLNVNEAKPRKDNKGMRENRGRRY